MKPTKGGRGATMKWKPSKTIQIEDRRGGGPRTPVVRIGPRLAAPGPNPSGVRNVNRRYRGKNVPQG